MLFPSLFLVLVGCFMLVVGACYGGCCCLWVVATVGACFAVAVCGLDWMDGCLDG